MAKMQREPSEIAKEFLEGLLVAQDIEPAGFYSLVGRLEKVFYLKDVRPVLSDEGNIQLRASYTGKEEIGRAMMQETSAGGINYTEIHPEIQRAVEGVYANLTARTRFEFHQPQPDLKHDQCWAFALVKDASALDQASESGKLRVILEKQQTRGP